MYSYAHGFVTIVSWKNKRSENETTGVIEIIDVNMHLGVFPDAYCFHRRDVDENKVFSTPISR